MYKKRSLVVAGTSDLSQSWEVRCLFKYVMLCKLWFYSSSIVTKNAKKNDS